MITATLNPFYKRTKMVVINKLNKQTTKSKRSKYKNRLAYAAGPIAYLSEEITLEDIPGEDDYKGEKYVSWHEKDMIKLPELEEDDPNPLEGLEKAKTFDDYIKSKNPFETYNFPEPSRDALDRDLQKGACEQVYRESCDYWGGSKKGCVMGATSYCRNIYVPLDVDVDE